MLYSFNAEFLFSFQIPLCKVIRFNIDYTIHFIEEMMPEVRWIISLKVRVGYELLECVMD